jgi:hypothetical protein
MGSFPPSARLSLRQPVNSPAKQSDRFTILLPYRTPKQGDRFIVQPPRTDPDGAEGGGGGGC